MLRELEHGRDRYQHGRRSFLANVAALILLRGGGAVLGHVQGVYILLELVEELADLGINLEGGHALVGDDWQVLGQLLHVGERVLAVVVVPVCCSNRTEPLATAVAEYRSIERAFLRFDGLPQKVKTYCAGRLKAKLVPKVTLLPISADVFFNVFFLYFLVLPITIKIKESFVLKNSAGTKKNQIQTTIHKYNTGTGLPARMKNRQHAIQMTKCVLYVFLMPVGDSCCSCRP